MRIEAVTSIARAACTTLFLAGCAHHAPTPNAPTPNAPTPNAPTPNATAVAAAPCTGTRYVEVRNTLKERAYVSIVTTTGRTFYVDDALAPDEVRRLRLPEGAHPARAQASSEPWAMGRREQLTPAQAVRQENSLGTQRSGVTSRLEVKEGCA